MPASVLTVPLPVVLAAGLAARILGVLVGAAATLPEVSLRVRMALGLAVTAAAFPMAVAARRLDPTALPPPDLGGAVFTCLGEAAVGLALGAAIAAIASAGAWAGGILGSVAGLSWADDFDPEGDAQSAGMARFAWWITCGVFLAAGGLQAIVVGVVDSVRVLPVGAVLAAAGGPAPDLGRVAAELPALAFSLCLSIAVPALLAVVAFHLTAAIALRTVPFAPGAGFLQSLAAVVLLAAVYLGADAWAHGFPALVQGPLERACGGGER